MASCGTEPAEDIVFSSPTHPAALAEPAPIPDDLPGLIDALAISDAPALPDPLITLSNEANATLAKRIYQVADKIESRGTKAFPLLIAHLDDRRQSVPMRNALPATVGDACFAILTRQLITLPAGYPQSIMRTGRDGGSHARPLAGRYWIHENQLAAWLNARKPWSIPNLRVEVTRWVLAEEQKIGVASEEDREKYIAPLTRHLRVLETRAAAPTS